MISSHVILPLLFLGLASAVANAQKTDVITFTNGDESTGEIINLERGKLEFSSFAMSTVNIKWPRIATVSTNKRFQIVLDDASIYFGSLESAPGNSVVILTDTASFVVATDDVVRLDRQDKQFLAALDGDMKFGFQFTQQNAKTDLDFGANIRYPRLSNLTSLKFDYSLSRQDDTDEIVSLDGLLAHARQMKNRWFYLAFLAAARNSQLSLEGRVSIGGGFGRLFVETNKVDVGVWVAPSVNRERFTGEEANTSYPLVMAADFGLFIWDRRDTEVSSRLAVMPMMNDLGRWRIEFYVTASHEVINDVSIMFGVSEQFDSKPPSVEANQNDFSLSTGIKWSF